MLTKKEQILRYSTSNPKTVKASLAKDSIDKNGVDDTNKKKGKNDVMPCTVMVEMPKANRKLQEVPAAGAVLQSTEKSKLKAEVSALT